MKKRRSRMTIQQKVLSGVGMLFACSFLALAIFFIQSYIQELNIELGHMRNYNRQLSMNLDRVVDTTSSFRYMHFSNDKIRNLLCSDDSDIDPEGQKKTEKDLEESLALLTDMGKDVLRAVIVTNDGRIYKSVEEIEDGYIKRMNVLLTQEKGWDQKKAGYFSPIHKTTVNLVEHYVVSMVSPIWNIVQEEPVAVIYLDLDFDKLTNQWYASVNLNQNYSFMILSEKQLLFDSEKSQEKENYQRLIKESRNMTESGKKDQIVKVHGKVCVISVEKNEDTGWYLMQYKPVSKLAERILNNTSALLLVLIGVIFITVTGSYVLAKNVSRPVKELSQFMGRVADVPEEEKEIALFSKKDTESTEEILQMIDSYNAMAKRINDNIIKDYIYKLNQKQAELKMLQFQINPHFLYNALNTISSIAQLQDVEYIPEIASGLSDMFRYNIDGREIVTLREEITQTENYMGIQKIRFPERFLVEICVDEDLMDCKVLKFILQPIVENSYKYGFAEKRKKNVLCIRGYREKEDDIIIIIEDNGAGIEAEKVSKINEALAGDKGFEASAGIGLRNVNARIKNYYGEDCGIWLESDCGKFTRVYLKIRELQVS
ncbi:MAG: histidine kinase [Blautia sp.]|nr:histidine kinase [Blautia sp.]